MQPLRPLDVDLHGVNLIEASAGTGKTWTITTLYLRMLLELPNVEVGNILVVTFTRAATAELKDRVRRRLRCAVAAFGGLDYGFDPDLASLVARRRGRFDPAHDRVRLQTALRNFDEAPILTLHAFCHRMLHQHAFESGVRFDTTLITDQSHFIDEIAYDFWARTVYEGADRATIKALAAQGVDPFTLRRLASVVAQRPDAKLLPSLEASLEGNRLAEQVELGPDGPGIDVLDLKRQFVRYVRDELPARKHAHNVEAFDDLIHILRNALGGERGPALGRALSGQYRAVLIDEFQDTDPAQYEIFRRAYRGSRASVFLIGDPKQSIYAFRSADVFAYLRAKQDATGRSFTLGRNWRSDPALIGAVNSLFGRVPRPFVFEQELIGYHPVEAESDRERLTFPAGSTRGPGLEFLFVPRRGKMSRKQKLISAYWAERYLPDLIAADVAQLLESGAEIDGRPVEAGDVAVLVWTNVQARGIQDALRSVGVPCALMGRASVLDSDEAGEVARVLSAVVSQRSRRALRAALATRLLGMSATDLTELEDDADGWQLWVGRFETWREDWQSRGFLPAFRRLLDDSGVGARLLGWVDGERRLTNYRHLGELLGRTSAGRKLDPAGLVSWLLRARANRIAGEELEEDATQLRLERDAGSVKVLTIHAAKGLEYPIVYCPYLWMGRLLVSDDKTFPRFHDRDDEDRLCLDLGSASFKRSLKAATVEALAENLRVTYVAITRARHRCTVVWGPFEECQKSPLAYLLHAPDKQVERPEIDAAVEVLGELKSGSDQRLLQRLEALSTASNGNVLVRVAQDLGGGRRQPTPRPAVDLIAPDEAPRVQRRWGRTSFSGLTSGQDHEWTPDEGDDPARAEAVADEERVVLHDFPRGPGPGSLVHEIFEELDFEPRERGALDALVAEKLTVWGVDPQKWTDVLAGALDSMLDVPLPTQGEPMPLRALSRVDRLDEMSFLLPLGTGGGPLTVARLATALGEFGNVPPSYPERVAALPAEPIKGFLTGFLDLVFRWHGRWYVVDYKTNHLGDRPSDYGAEHLVDAMSEHHYYLQYHFYTVALHRYLRRRLPGYDYETHMGGAMYLFLRGLGPDGQGVFADRPSLELVEALDAALDGRPT